MLSRRIFLYLVMFLNITLLVHPSWSATVSGTITNNSGKSGWINLNLINQYGSSGLGTAVKLNSSASSSYEIVGVPDGSYSVDAYLDSTSTGMRHANDPAASAQVTVNNGLNVSQNLTLGLPGSTTLSAAPQLFIVPTSQGAFVQVDTANQTDANGRLIADSYSLSCGASTPTPIIIPSNDNAFAILTGLTNGSTLSCTATPVVNGVADNAHSVSANSPIGDCNVAGNCAAGTAHLTGKVTFGNGVSYSGKPLYVAAVPPSGGQPYVAGIASVSTNPVSFDIYGVPAGDYKVYTILDVNSSRIIGDADLQTQDTGAPVVTVTGLDSVVTLPTVTLNNVNSYLEFGVNHGKKFAQNDMDYNFILQLTGGLKRPVKFNIKNIDQTTLLYTIGRDNYGSGFWSFGQNMPRPVISATVGYADITYDNNDVDSNIPLTVRAIPDEFPFISFPSGNVHFPDSSNPLASWRTPGPLPGYYFSYRGWLGGCNSNGDNPNDFILNSKLSTSFTNCPQPSGSGNGWNLMLRDQFGNMTEQYTSFTPQTSGPTISGISPSSGTLTQPITITGSGFTGATSVSINGYGMISSVTSDTQLTINPSGNATGFYSGPILVTNNGITAASSTSFTGLTQVAGTITTSAGGSNYIANATIALVDSNPLQSTLSAGTATNSATYTLQNIPAGIPYSLKITANGYQPAYTKTMLQTGNGTGYNWSLFTAPEIAGWGVASGKGVIRARVTENLSGGTNQNVSGATVTASSWLHPDTPYVVKYDEGTGLVPGNGSSTPANGFFYVMDIDEGDIVTVQASKTGFAFQPTAYQVHADAVSQGRIQGAAVPTGISASTTTQAQGDGSYAGPISVSFALTPSATYFGSILYTTDGTDPRFYGTSLSLTGQVPLSSTATVKYVFKSSLNGMFGPMGTTAFVIRQTPTINGINTNTGNSGENLILNGQFPDSNLANYQVLFNGITPATNLSISMSSQMQFTVPPGVYSYFTVNYFGQTVFTGNLLSVAISGSGSVNDTGPQATGFYCAIGTCNRYFGSTVPLLLSPTPSLGNVFQGWTPTCSGGSDCSITMSTPVSKTATFVPDVPKPFKISGTNVTDDVLQNVYEQVFTNNYPTGTIIQALAGTGPYSQDFTANRNVDVIIKGGFDNGFSSNSGTYTTIHAINPPVTIQSGKVVVEGIKVF